jgi:CRP/FNR family transcriptional regulator, cyclic AMP receptor protein
MDTLERILVEHPFFQGMKKEHLEIIVGCASNVRLGQGGFVFRANEEANYFYLIRHGKVALETARARRSPVTILRLADGEILGWSWLVPPYRWKFDARVEQPTRAIKLNGKCMREKWEKDHDLGFELLNRFATVHEQRLDAVQRALSMVTDAA